MQKVLVVEDSLEYQKIIGRTLDGYNLLICGSAEEAQIHLSSIKFDIILVDINLPAKDGFSFIAEIQNHKLNLKTPVLCLTGRCEIQDKITAFDLGAEDYLTKPFDPLELKIRVQSKLKKNLELKQTQLSLVVGDISIDQETHKVYVEKFVSGRNQKIKIDLTHTEFKLLNCMARKPEQVFSREELLTAAWGNEVTVLDRVIDVHICLLRKKLVESSLTIKAVSGTGYKLTHLKKNLKMSAQFDLN